MEKYKQAESEFVWELVTVLGDSNTTDGKRKYIEDVHEIVKKNLWKNTST